MNDILLPIAFSTLPFLPVLLVATFIYIAITSNTFHVRPKKLRRYAGTITGAPTISY